MEQKINLKTVGVAAIWVGVLAGVLYFIPFDKILPAEQDASAELFASAKLVASEEEFDFGVIPITGGKVRHSYQLINEGPDAINVSKVWTSCMCTIAEVKTVDGTIYGPFGMSGHGGNIAFVGVDIPAGEKFELTAEFDPMAHGPDAVGPIQRAVYIKTNAAKEPLGLSFAANVVR